jgi:AcrR family transcriptional regulator
MRDRTGELFPKAGYGNITVEGITNHLGFSKAILYYHHIKEIFTRCLTRGVFR